MAKPTQLPLAHRLLRTLLQVLSLFAPSLVIRWLYWRWFRSPRYKTPPREQAWLDKAQKCWLPHALGNMAYYRWGDGDKPYVLLMHGWSGRASQMGAFAQPLVEAGYAVVALDAPGHGSSPGKSTTLFRIADVMQTLVTQLGTPRAVIAHSFGCIVTARALHEGMLASGVILISSPTRAEYLFAKFIGTLQLSATILQGFRRRFELEFGKDVWQRIDADSNARTLHVPALILHDRDDTEVAPQCSDWLADAWRGSILEYSQGLGHRRILRDAVLIQRCVAFIRQL
jgi:pimeloyl-ACP methyl ester carboxylesterase